MLSLLSAPTALTMPPVSPTGVANKLWSWRGFNIRYQEVGASNADGPVCILVHGLFVNADHWRRNLPALAEAGCRAYAVDLLGYGYSDKPPSTDPAASAASGENGRPLGAPVQQIGSASGEVLPARPVPLAHPVEGSVYNFYTWAEQLADFTKQVIGAESTTLVANSIGSISALQAAAAELAS